MIENNVAAATPTGAASSVTFSTLNISQQMLAVLTRNGFTKPTPIQEKSIPIALEGKDIIGIAQTGTGKTLAFGIPMIERLVKGSLNGQKMRGLIILPTRELALQVEETFRKIGSPMGITSTVLIGGASMHFQKQDLRRNPHVIIATPGRLWDHMEQKTVSLGDIGVLVLDEADHMFDMGFAPQINRILKTVPKGRQTLLFSATMPPEIVKLALAHMQLPLRIEVAPAGTSAEKVEQEIVVVRKEAKFHLLEKVLGEHSGTILVFARTKHGARKIAHGLNGLGHRSAEIHSNRSLGQRKEALNGFKSGKYRILVATDIAARGIDVNDIEVVVNYDLPDNIQDYVHRIGRTARAGKKGKAISFASPDQMRDVSDIERLIRKKLPMKRHESPAGYVAPQVPFMADESRGGGRDRHRSGGRSSGRPFHGGSSSRSSFAPRAKTPTVYTTVPGSSPRAPQRQFSQNFQRPQNNPAPRAPGSRPFHARPESQRPRPNGNGVQKQGGF